jgi:hypothetical protein
MKDSLQLLIGIQHELARAKRKPNERASSSRNWFRDASQARHAQFGFVAAAMRMGKSRQNDRKDTHNA